MQLNSGTERKKVVFTSIITFIQQTHSLQNKDLVPRAVLLKVEEDLGSPEIRLQKCGEVIDGPQGLGVLETSER